MEPIHWHLSRLDVPTTKRPGPSGVGIPGVGSPTKDRAQSVPVGSYRPPIRPSGRPRVGHSSAYDVQEGSSSTSRPAVDRRRNPWNCSRRCL